MSLAQQQELESKYMMGTFARKPVEFVSGNGMTLTDDKGKQYLDFIGGIGVVSLGHCTPALVKTLQEQTAKLMHVSNYYYIEHRGEVAEKLSGILGGTTDAGKPIEWKTFFSNSGAESNECAIKLARLYAKRLGNGGSTIVTITNSFHGRTLATLAATAQPLKQEAFKPLPGGFVDVPQNDVAALEAAFANHDVCAVILEVVQGESGVHPCSQEYLEAVRRLTSENKALMICDEVQCGMYRCGVPFAFQHYGITPDIVAMAKGIAGGVPMGACAARAEVADAFGPGDHGTTFGGSCLAIAAANCVLDELGREGEIERSRRRAFGRTPLGAAPCERGARSGPYARGRVRRFRRCARLGAGRSRRAAGLGAQLHRSPYAAFPPSARCHERRHRRHGRPARKAYSSLETCGGRNSSPLLKSILLPKQLHLPCGRYKKADRQASGPLSLFEPKNQRRQARLHHEGRPGMLSR